jgi:hypothetical protein
VVTFYLCCRVRAAIFGDADDDKPTDDDDDDGGYAAARPSRPHLLLVRISPHGHPRGVDREVSLQEHITCRRGMAGNVNVLRIKWAGNFRLISPHGQAMGLSAQTSGDRARTIVHEVSRGNCETTYRSRNQRRSTRNCTIIHEVSRANCETSAHTGPRSLKGKL